MNAKIGTNAGLIWEYLNNSKGAQKLKDVKKDCKLTEKDAYAALGWLAREGKVAFNKLKDDIEIALL